MEFVEFAFFVAFIGKETQATSVFTLQKNQKVKLYALPAKKYRKRFQPFILRSGMLFLQPDVLDRLHLQMPYKTPCPPIRPHNHLR